MPLQCRALLPRRSCPRRGLFSGPFPCGFGPSCSLCASLRAENGVPLLESVLSILITCELEGTPPPYLGRVASEYMGRKSKIYECEKQFMSWAAVVPALPAQGIL